MGGSPSRPRWTFGWVSATDRAGVWPRVFPQIYPKNTLPRRLAVVMLLGQHDRWRLAKVAGPKSSVSVMRVVLTRIWFLIVMSLSAVTIGILLTASTRQWLWVAIAGSVLTVVGAIAATTCFSCRHASPPRGTFAYASGADTEEDER